MKRRRLLGRIATLTVGVMLIMLMTVPVYAASAYSALTGVKNKISFDKYLVVDQDTSIPAAVFSFTVEAGEEVTPTVQSGQLKVFSGPDAGKIIIGDNGKTTFVAGQETIAGTESDGIKNSTAVKYAKNVVAIDISRVTFTHPGVYRYIIKEKPQLEDSPFKNDTVSDRTLDVYIQDDNGKLAFQGYVLYSGIVNIAPEATAAGQTQNGTETKKSDKFINSYVSYDLTAGKQVTGNQGSIDKYFKVIIKLTATQTSAITDDSLYTIDTTGYEASPVKTDATSYDASELIQPADVDGNTENGIQVFGSTLKTGLVVYLKHGQYIRIEGLPAGVEYEVTEEAEKYSSTASSAENTVTYNNINAMDSTSGILNADKTVGFKNSKDGVIPTGILISVIPWIIVGVIVVAGIIFFAVRSGKKHDEE